MGSTVDGRQFFLFEKTKNKFSRRPHNILNLLEDQGLFCFAAVLSKLPTDLVFLDVRSNCGNRGRVSEIIVINTTNG